MQQIKKSLSSPHPKGRGLCGTFGCSRTPHSKECGFNVRDIKKNIKQNPFARWQTLETVLMVEKTINDHSGEFNRTQLWKKLPKKVMWQTYLIILDYLG